MNDLRPGYCPPNRREIGGPLLDFIYEEEKEKVSKILEGETVCVGFDGWSNVHNEPIMCVTITITNGDVYLADIIDTSGKPHTAEYLADVTKDSIQKCEEEFKVKVRSVVTDNAANVTKMRRFIQNDESLDVITYGCSAHILNLLSNDLQVSDVKKHVLSVIKYFRNNHYANACFRQSGCTKLIVPSEIRWNTLVDCFQSYIKAWSTLIKICEENRDAIDKTVQQKVSNISLKRNVEDLLQLLTPISVTLDKVQKNDCTLSESVRAWKELLNLVTEDASKNQVKIRYDMAITPAHLLAYMLDPREKTPDLDLTTEEKESALEFANERYPDSQLLPLIIKFQAQSSPFQKTLFQQQVTEEVTAYDWWKSQRNDLNKFNVKVFPIIRQLFTARPSSASVERIFSSFGLVHSKIRNRLGIQKASKLVFLFKVFNSEVSVDVEES